LSTTFETTRARFFRQVNSRLHKLLWLHSLWALLLGLAVMFFFRHDFRFIRLAVGYLAFIWVASYVLHWEADRFRVDEEHHPKIRRVVQYVIQNFYHEMLFFLLPFYYESTTFPSLNMVFFLMVCLAALLACFDVVYWRWLARRAGYARGFYAFILFACVNVFIPVLFGIPNRISLYLAAAVAAMTLVAPGKPIRHWRIAGLTFRFLAIPAAAMLLIFLLKGFVPPAPLQVAQSDFGLSLNPRTLTLRSPISSLQEAEGRDSVYFLASIKAPVGLSERVGLRWYRDGQPANTPRFVEVQGGRKSGYRLWSRVSLTNGAVKELRIDLVSEGGQLIGRARLH